VIALALSLAALGQLPVDSSGSDGAIAGRVCADSNRDGRCGDDEPGLAGARVLMETGLSAVTDASGRFHLFGVQSRSVDGLAGGRVLPGRHRLTVDARLLTAGSAVQPRAQTVEVPLGGLSWAEFAVASPLEAPPSLKRVDATMPKGAFEQETLQWWWSAKAENAIEVTVDGKVMKLNGDNVFSGWVALPGDGRDVPVVMHPRAGKAVVLMQRFDVIRRDRSVMVVPREARVVGELEASSAVWATGQARLKGIAGSTVTIAGTAYVLDERGEGQAVLALKPGLGFVSYSWRTPGLPAIEGRLYLPSDEGVVAVGLLDLEGTFDLLRGEPRLFGRGAGTVRARWQGFDWAADLDLRDADFPLLQSGQGMAWVQPRQSDTFERALTALRAPLTGVDDSVTSASNGPEGRFRLEVAKEGVFKLGYGSYRAQMRDAEVGRYHRAVWAGYAEARSSDEARFGVKAEAFATPATSAVTSGLASTPRHDVLEATGGSLFYLSSGDVVFGSEKVRVEWRDGLTDLPLKEQHLRRGLDYSLDCLTGRLLLGRGPALFDLASVLPGQSLGGAARPYVIVDYEALSFDPGTALVGGELTLRGGPVRFSAGVVRENRGYSLLRSTVKVPIGPVTITAEAAYSLGQGAEVRVSDDGGLAFNTLSGKFAAQSGYAVGLRARGPAYGPDGFFEVAYRRRGAGYSDSEHFDAVTFQQISARAEQPFGRLRVGVLMDDRQGLAVDSETPSAQRIWAGWVGWKEKRWGVSVSARDASYADLQSVENGAGTSVALAGNFRVAPWLNLSASHRQRLLSRGDGPGAMDDTFASLGAEISAAETTTVTLRGGYGPAIGPQVWGGVAHRSGAETYYGGHRWDVDAPSVGGHRMVAGASREVALGDVVYAEDVAQTDNASVSVSRAVGFSVQGQEGLSVSARYERGVREALVLAGTQPREAMAGSLSWVAQGARAFVRAELRRQQKTKGELSQWLGSGGAELAFSQVLRGTAMVLGTHSAVAGVLSARSLEGQVGMHVRLEHGLLSFRYLYQRELPPVSRGGFGERTLHVLSVLPTYQVSDRLRLAAGGHLAWVGTDTSGGWVLTASLRPTVRVWEGLEVGAEVARRSIATDGGELTSLRGEVGYRFNSQVMMAVGYTAFGFQGLGFNDGQADARDRLYVRAEVGY
jgi:protein-disulfide isomerase-like protein with CxxC motif